MKKIIPILTLFLMLSVFTACGNAENTAESSTTAVTGEATEATAAETISETETTTEAATEEIAEGEFQNIAGNWYLDGDKSGEYIAITADGAYESYLADGTLTSKGTAKHCDEDMEGTILHWVNLYDENGDFYVGFQDDGSEDMTEMYLGNGGLIHYFKLS